MKIIPLDGWNAAGSHDSQRQPRDLVELIRQVGALPGLATQNYTGVPSIIKLFAEKCIFGERPIYLIKGLHQRWNKGNRAAEPHLRVRFSYTQGPEGKLASKDMHIQLSEEPSAWSDGNFGWKTVGVTYVVGDQNVQSWPPVYSQEVGQIQEQQGRRFKRRYSVGCLPPPQMANAL